MNYFTTKKLPRHNFQISHFLFREMASDSANCVSKFFPSKFSTNLTWYFPFLTKLKEDISYLGRYVGSNLNLIQIKALDYNHGILNWIKSGNNLNANFVSSKSILSVVKILFLKCKKTFWARQQPRAGQPYLCSLIRAVSPITSLTFVFS